MTPPPFGDWDQVAAFAMTLPGCEIAPFYGKPAVKVRGKAFVSPGGEPGSFHVRSPHAEKVVLLATDPATFWQTPHYANWPGLLVRYGSPERERIERVIVRAWWDRAGKAGRSAVGERP